MSSPVIPKLIRNVRRFARMTPGYAALRLQAELWRRLDRRAAGRQEKRLDLSSLLKRLDQTSFGALKEKIKNQGVPYDTNRLKHHYLDQFSPGATEQIIELANDALNGWVCLLGSGRIQLGKINWAMDYKSGFSWPFAHYSEIDTTNLDQASDVKFPWDLSRLHWLIPVAQAYRITGDERYSTYVRQILESWITSNPCGWGVNWSCTMEPAMRVFSWTWLYKNLHHSKSWQDESFQFKFLQALYLHLRFIRHNLEITDINGNHLTADASALIVGGAFFGDGLPLRWQQTGWQILKREIKVQVLPDGVDFEASVPYHRLVTELFFVAAATLEQNNHTIPRFYIDRLLSMGEYIKAYTKPDGNAPIIGDADDARTLPLGQQSINDHRYLPNLIAARWASETLAKDWSQSASECLWWWGQVPTVINNQTTIPSSRIFQSSGNVIMRANNNYVFIDSGMVGLAGRGGHGHNDCLSFEATLLGCNLIVDPGCPTYTGDWQLRNSFRSTSAHSTPMLANEEINRFVSPRDLWSLHNDAKGEIKFWGDDSNSSQFCGIHKGYHRLDPSATVQRALILDKERNALVWEDRILGTPIALMRVALQLAPDVNVFHRNENWLRLSVNEKDFIISWDCPTHWRTSNVASLVSPSYGVVDHATRIEWIGKSEVARQLRCYLYQGNELDAMLQFSLDLEMSKLLVTVEDSSLE